MLGAITNTVSILEMAFAFHSSLDLPLILPATNNQFFLLTIHLIFTVLQGKLIFSRSTTLHQFSSVTQLCPTLCDPMNHSTPGLPVHHQLPESTQTHVPGKVLNQHQLVSTSSSSKAPPFTEHTFIWRRQMKQGNSNKRHFKD